MPIIGRPAFLGRPVMSEFEDLDSFDTFLAIVAKLRGPDGCPWDRAQSHETLRRYIIEECHEAVDAIDEGDRGHLAEELGDVLLQVGLHAQIGADEGTFTIADVLRSINAESSASIDQAVQGGRTPAADVVLTWLSWRDERGRHAHRAMDRQRRAYGQPFESPTGAQLMYPGGTSLGVAATMWFPAGALP